jgi:MFS family permease
MSKKLANDAAVWAWVTVGVLVPVALLNYLDRQMLAAMKPSMMADLPDIATKANWGFVLGAFKWVYAALSPIGGFVADRSSRRHVIAGSLFVWSAVTWATGHVDSYTELVIARALMGVSEAFYIPAALALITDFHPGSTRSRAVGLHQMGIYAGILIGGFAGYAAETPAIGWRGAFTSCGIVGICYAIPLFLLLRSRPGPTENVTSKAGGDTDAGRSVWRELLGNANFLLLVAYFTLPALAGWVVKDWMPDILRQQFRLGEGKAGVSAVVYVQIASLIGVFVGGWLADTWMKRSVRGRIYISAIGMSFFLPALFGVGNATTLGMAILFLVLFGIGWGFFDCNNMPILCQIASPRSRATGYGLMNMVSISCGGFADWGFGYLRDRDVPLNVIFGVFAGVALISIGLVLMIRPNSEQRA